MEKIIRRFLDNYFDGYTEEEYEIRLQIGRNFLLEVIQGIGTNKQLIKQGAIK